MGLLGTAGAQWRRARERQEVQATAELMVGARSYNYDGAYNMSGGVYVRGWVGMGSLGEKALVFGLHLDGAVLTLPVAYVVGALKGE